MWEVGGGRLGPVGLPIPCACMEPQCCSAVPPPQGSGHFPVLGVIMTVVIFIAIFATLTGQQVLAEPSIPTRSPLGAPPEPRVTLAPACRGWGHCRDPFTQGHGHMVWRSWCPRQRPPSRTHLSPVLALTCPCLRG